MQHASMLAKRSSILWRRSLAEFGAGVKITVRTTPAIADLTTALALHHRRRDVKFDGRFLSREILVNALIAHFETLDEAKAAKVLDVGLARLGELMGPD
jgi:hypothetical protein